MTFKSNYNKEAYSDSKDAKTPAQSSWEKTPMCLVNDLARFNKISFQYRLTGEKGPAHCKQFTVTLELGDEQYTAEGFKIKKAQHLAAKEAMQRTKYKHPIPKLNRRNEDHGASRANVTPTVELNALAMKLGLQTCYIFDPRQIASAASNTSIFETIQQPRYKVKQGLGSNMHMKSILIPDQTQLHSDLNFTSTFVPNLTSNPAFISVQQGNHNRTKFQHCYPVVRTSQHLNSTLFAACRITLIVGADTFFGVGRTIQQAKHDAAAQAILKLKEQMACQQSESLVENLDENDHKSPISLVFEIGIKRNLSVDFKILREDGPAHMRKFITACIVGDIVTEGEGTGKKVSKKIAAQKMIEELNKLTPLSPFSLPVKHIKSKTPPKKILTSLLKHKNVSQVQKLSKEKCQEIDFDIDNPIAKMMQWCQDSNYSQPVFKTIAEKGKHRSRRGQFVVEVTSNNCTVQGFGNNKKSAKRNAAQNFLTSVGSNTTEKLSVSGVDIIPIESRQKVVQIDEKNFLTSVGSNTTEKLSVSAVDIIPTESRHKVLRNDEKNFLTSVGSNTTEKLSVSVDIIPTESRHKVLRNDEKGDTTSKPYDHLSGSIAVVANDDLSIGNSHTAKSSNKTQAFCSAKVKDTGFHMKDKLLYLARLIGFEVDFSDYPKGNHNEFLTILMISTNPPQICHGFGVNAEESQEDASRNALNILSEMGLNN